MLSQKDSSVSCTRRLRPFLSGISISFKNRLQRRVQKEKLTKRNLVGRLNLRERSPQTVLFHAGQGWNKPGSAIGGGDLSLRLFRVDPYA